MQTGTVQIVKELVRDAAHPLTGSGADYDSLLEFVGDARFVLLGEGTHGTHEFYRQRAQITKRLIEEKGFTAVAVEADWPDAYRVNRYVRAESNDRDAAEALSGFKRFPAWMWRNADVLDFIEPYVKPGVTTDELDRRCHDFIVEHGAIPAPLNYKGFPRSICTSINEVVCHGIPGPRVLRDGDIINIDITTILEGYFGDTSEMFFVGEVSDAAKKLVDVTRRSMWLGIKEVTAGNRIGDIGAAIHETVEATASLMLIVAFATAFAFYLTWEGIPQELLRLLLGRIGEPLLVLLILNLVLLVAGMFLDTVSAMIILVPIIHPIAVRVGIDPVHIGLIVVLNLTIGGVTPPVGLLMYLSNAIIGCTVGEFTRAAWPFLVALLVVLMLVILFPALSLTIPNALFG